MNEKHSQILGQLNRFSPTLIDRFETLTEKDWSTQSRCSDWTVKDVMSHLTTALATYLQIIETAKNTEDIRNNPKISYSEPGTLDGKSVASRVSQRARESSRNFKSNNELVVEFGLRFKKLLDGFNSCEEHHWGLKAYHPVNWVSIYEMLLWTLFESSIHAWDALNAVDDEYIIDKDLAPLLPQYFCNDLINRWFKTPDSPENLSQTLAVNFGSSEGLLIASSKGNLDIQQCAINSFDADAEINTSASEFALLITGRKDLAESMEDFSTQLKGDSSHIASFSRWFTGS
ncbi:MAG: Mycothiol maleylpyruvate isomerase N-terminal domain-containing protein [Chloroflexi bacterium]|jgi:uncharacterized protein (TIGR03083 family)|nr:MAG: Mycothiol maleylpyruvate isomerase N-terminal domain-containing protein [Chloroflexota bacterium]